MVKRELQQLRRQQEHSFQYTENITVLRENKKIVGLYSCQEEGESLDNGIYIWNLCVSPKSRGKGYGTKLTQHAIKSCSKAGHELKLLVYKDNTRAQYIYKKQGFKFDNWDYDVDSEENFYNKHRMKFIKKALPHQD